MRALLSCLSKKSWQTNKITQKFTNSRNFHYLPKMSSFPSTSSPGSRSESPPLPGLENFLTDDLVEDFIDDDMSNKFRDMDLDAVRLYLAYELGFRKPPIHETPEKVLNEVNLDGIIKWIESERCQNIITLAGAGISTSAGIPDFRSPETGLYHNLQKYNLPVPQAIFEISFFKQNPKPFFTLAKELFPGKFQPTVSHYFVKLLHDKGRLLRHYTQNIDTLERGAGIPEEKLVESHGTFYTSHCIECRKEYSLEFIKERIFADEIPICTECPGVVKPDIVFFGESMPSKFHQCLQEDFPKCDLLIIMGTSLEVEPFASLIDRVPSWCPRLLINREKTGMRNPIYRMLTSGGLGLHFADDSTRDVALLGDCDDGCRKLAEKLGWADELHALVDVEPADLKQVAPHAPVVVAPVSPIAPIAPIAPLVPESPQGTPPTPQSPTEDPVPGLSSLSTPTSEAGEK